MRLGGLCYVVVIIAACGGTSTVPDDGGLPDGTTDGGSDGNTDGGNNDGAPKDSGGDVIALDAAECTPPDTACATTCPVGTFCLKSSGPVSHDLGCTTIPPECNGVATCACMANCFCPAVNQQKCVAFQNYLECETQTVSRREYKKDITYLGDDDRVALADEALHTRLAEYRYKTESQETPRHLGFIIDDMPNASPAVQADKTHVDLYGYTSMLLATVQEQQRQIDDLKKQVDALNRK